LIYGPVIGMPMILIPLTLPRTRNPLELCRMLVLARRDRVVLEYLPLVKAIAVRIAAIC
jgi:hypothetical protein